MLLTHRCTFCYIFTASPTRNAQSQTSQRLKMQIKYITIASHSNRTRSKLCGLILMVHLCFAAAIQPQLGAYENIVVQQHAHTRNTTKMAMPDIPVNELLSPMSVRRNCTTETMTRTRRERLHQRINNSLATRLRGQRHDN